MVADGTESNGFNLFLQTREIVEQTLRHLVITLSSSYFFNKTDLEQYLYVDYYMMIKILLENFVCER